MDITDVDLAELAPERMQAAYLEYRRSCYGFIYRAAVEHGVIDQLNEPITGGEFAARMNVAPGKVEVAGLLLDALTRFGAVRRDGQEPPRYVAVPGFAAPEGGDSELIRLATGKNSYEELAYSDSFARVVTSLTSEEKPALAAFDAASIALWEQGMLVPYYRYLRLQAVNTLVAAGSRLLDLASGTGLGLLELAERVPADRETDLLGVEISADFVRAADERTASDDRIRVMRGDLERPLPFLRDDHFDGHFDGAMVVGAYHYLRDPKPMWDNVARVLRPGGVLCLAMVLSRTDGYDRELLDLRYAQRTPAALPVERSEVISLAAARDFHLEREFWLGCFAWYAFRKK